MGEWRTTTLGEICAESGGSIQTGPFGSQLHASDYVTTGTPSVMPQNIGDNRIEPHGIARVSDADVERLSRHKLVPGDIVYSRRGDVERRALVRDENRGWLCGTGCLRVRIGDHSVHDPRFVSYALGTEASRKWVVRHAVGATMLNLNTGILSGVPLRVPGIGEQKAIAEVLGALDDKIAVNDRIGALSKELLAAVFQRLEVDEAGDTSLEHLIELNPKLKVDGTSGVPYLEMKNLPDSSMTVSEWSHRAPRGGARFQNGDTLLARITPCLENGKVGMVDFLSGDQVGVGSTEFIVMRARPGIPTVLPYFLATSDRFREFAIRHMVGTTGRQRLAAADLAPFSVRRPSSGALNCFGSLADVVLARVKAAVDESRVLTRTRDELLPLLMSGRIRVKDAEETVEGVV